MAEFTGHEAVVDQHMDEDEQDEEQDEHDCDDEDCQRCHHHGHNMGPNS